MEDNKEQGGQNLEDAILDASAGTMDGDVSNENTPDPNGAPPAPQDGEPAELAPGQEAEPADPRSQMAALEAKIAELTEFRDNTEKRFAENQEKKSDPAPAQPRNEAAWQEIERSFGFETTKDKETGDMHTEFDRRKFLQTFEKTLERVATTIMSDVNARFHIGMNRFTVDSAILALEKRPGNPLADIRQYSQAIKKHLDEWHNPEDHAKPKVIENAYWTQKGMGLKDAVKKAEQRIEKNLKVIHPAGGGQGKPGAGNPAPRRDMNGDAGKFLNRAGW